jgi:hypothetical protein
MPKSQITIPQFLSFKLLRIVIIGIAVSFQVASENDVLGQTQDVEKLTQPLSESSNRDATINRTNELKELAEQRSRPALDPGRVKSINDRIQLLTSLLDEDKTSSKTKSNEPPKSTAPEVGLESAPSNAESTPTDSSASQNNDWNANNSSNLVQSMNPKITLVGAKISEPINTLELGYSLYMTRNYEAAEKNFVQLLAPKIESSEAAWLHCMIGCCRSLQSQFTASDESFRKCIDQRNAPQFMVKYCEWKIGHLNGRSKAIQALNDIKTEFNSITTDD